MGEPTTLPVNFWDKVDASGVCWEWTGGRTKKGYGQCRVDGRQRYVHRLSWSALVGPIPDGLVIDHLCRVRHCVNPDHLQPVTNRENVVRGLARNLAVLRRAPACDRGHPFDDRNTYVARNGSRHCRECRRAADRRRSQHV